MDTLPLKAFVKNPVNLGYRILAFDPGETIGWSIMCNSELLDCGQIMTAEWTVDQINEVAALFRKWNPDIVVYEAYRIYSWKTESHAWNEVHTAQIIGIIRFLCLQAGIPYDVQTAQIAKQFCTDDKLHSWGLIKRGARHARDSIRHNCYWLLFGDYAKLWTVFGESAAKKKP